MNVRNVKNGAFYIARAPYNWNTVIIEDVGEYGCLKILANAKKYFTGYYPEFWRVDGKTMKKLTNTTLKSFFKNALKYDKKYFTNAEIQELGKYFKIKVDLLSAHGWSKDHYNYNKAEKWEKKPAKRKIPARNVKKKTTRKM